MEAGRRRLGLSFPPKRPRSMGKKHRRFIVDSPRTRQRGRSSRRWACERQAPEATFRRAARGVGLGSGQTKPAEDAWDAFWAAARRLDASRAFDIAAEIANRPGVLPYRVKVRTLADPWQPLASVLFPGPIVPSDGSRDREATIDETFHRRDLDPAEGIGHYRSPCTRLEPLVRCRLRGLPARVRGEVPATGRPSAYPPSVATSASDTGPATETSSDRPRGRARSTYSRGSPTRDGWPTPTSSLNSRQRSPTGRWAIAARMVRRTRRLASGPWPFPR